MMEASYDASTQIDDYLLYVSIYLNKNNSKRNVLVQAFYELVKNNLYPIDEWRLFFVEA